MTERAGYRGQDWQFNVLDNEIHALHRVVVAAVVPTRYREDEAAHLYSLCLRAEKKLAHQRPFARGALTLRRRGRVGALWEATACIPAEVGQGYLMTHRP